MNNQEGVSGAGLDSIVGTDFLFAGRYRADAVVGRGGMANVYRGTDIRLQRRVAIKALRPEVAVDSESRKRFQREAHSVSAMAHPNIVRVYDVGEQIIAAASAHTPIPFIVMEYIDGKVLRNLMDSGPFDPKVAVHVALGILDALEASHRAGIIHRDIKPGNIMLTETGIVKVCDFGIAQVVEDPTNDPSAIVGTAQYFSPEQAKGEIIDARSDLYSTAVVLFEMLAGSSLFSGDTAVSIAFQHVTQTAPRVRSRRPELSPELDMVVAKGLEKDRDRRFRSAKEFANALRSLKTLVGGGRADLAATPPLSPPLPVSESSNSIQAEATLPRVESQLDTGTETNGNDMDIRDQLKDIKNTLDLKELRPLLESDEPPKEPTARLILMVAASLLVVASVAAGMMFWVLTLNSSSNITNLAIVVPDVTNKTYAEAELELTNLGLQVTHTTAVSDTVPAGSVIETTPAAGLRVAKGEIITVVESTGLAQSTIPSITNMTVEEAQAALEAAGFVFGEIIEVADPDAAVDEVVGSSPEEGTQAQGGSVIDIQVSNGQVEVPDVVGKTLAEASALLQGTTVQLTVTVEADSGCNTKLVSSQSIAPGPAKQHSEITIVYCAGS